MISVKEDQLRKKPWEFPDPSSKGVEEEEAGLQLNPALLNPGPVATLPPSLYLSRFAGVARLGCQALLSLRYCEGRAADLGSPQRPCT